MPELKKIYFEEEYRKTKGIELLAKQGIEVYQIEDQEVVRFWPET